jgi:transposase
MGVPDTITLLLLQPYAPELNPVEATWEDFRANPLSFRVGDTHEATRDARCEVWNALVAKRAFIKSIAAPAWSSVSL